MTDEFEVRCDSASSGAEKRGGDGIPLGVGTI